MKSIVSYLKLKLEFYSWIFVSVLMNRIDIRQGK